MMNPTRLALLGHSMGSGAVMSAAVAIASTLLRLCHFTHICGVTRFTHNLQCRLVESFIANAERILQQAGGENQNLAHKARAVLW